MKLLLIHLRRSEYFDDVLLALTQTGMHDPVVLDALGGENRMLADIPIFAGFMGGRGRQKEFHRIILAPVEDAAVADRIVEALRDGGIDWTKEQIGTLGILPLEKWIG